MTSPTLATSTQHTHAMPYIYQCVSLRQLFIHPTKWRSLIFCLPLFWITPTPAQTPELGNSMYVGASVGRLLADKMSRGAINQALQQQGLAVSTLHADDRSAGAKIYTGYQFHPNWALEVAYSDLGSYDFDGQVIADPGSVHAKFKANDWHVGLLALFPWNNKLSLFGKVGMGYWRTELQASGTFSAQGAQRVTNNGSSPVLGVGATLRFTPELSGRFEWERFQDIGSIAGSGRADIDMATIGLQYNY